MATAAPGLAVETRPASRCTCLTERHQLAPAFVPQHEPHAAQAVEKRDAAEIAQLGMVPEHLGQPVKYGTRLARWWTWWMPILAVYQRSTAG